MAQLRAVLTELLDSGSGTAGVALDRLEAFAAREQALRAATLVLAIVEPATGAIRYATCGHPSPLIIGANGTTRYLESSGGGPLGIGSRQAPSRLGTLGPGDALFLYSDGLIERPGRTLAESLSELSLVAADVAATASCS